MVRDIRKRLEYARLKNREMGRLKFEEPGGEICNIDMASRVKWLG